MTAEELLCALSEDAVERLRWLVCRLFRIPPGEAPSDSECIWAAANMVLDARGGESGSMAGANPAFDEERFERLKR